MATKVKKYISENGLPFVSWVQCTKCDRFAVVGNKIRNGIIDKNCLVAHEIRITGSYIVYEYTNGKHAIHIICSKCECNLIWIFEEEVLDMLGDKFGLI